MEVDGTDAAAEQAPVQGPLVFQCSKCSHIIGDSFAMVEAIESLSAIILTGAVNCHEEEKLHLSEEGYDLGCTYVSVVCDGCDADLGRVYKTTSRKLDHIRDLFSLQTTVLKSYVLGSAGIAPVASDGTPPMESAATKDVEMSHDQSANFGEILQTEKEKLLAAIDEQRRLLEQQNGQLSEQANQLRIHDELLRKLKEDQDTRGHTLKTELQQAAAGEFTSIRTKVQELDETVLKIKQLWVHFDERIKAFETFTNTILAAAETDPSMGATTNFNPTVHENHTEAASSSQADGDSKKKRKRNP